MLNSSCFDGEAEARPRGSERAKSICYAWLMRGYHMRCVCVDVVLVPLAKMGIGMHVSECARQSHGLVSGSGARQRRNEGSIIITALALQHTKPLA